jgi:hypothetical protein
MTILKALQDTSMEHRMTRNVLCTLTQLNDRVLREKISELRRQGHYIVSDTSRKGYWLGTPQEWNAFCEQQRRRALSNFYKKTDEDDKQLRIV